MRKIMDFTGDILTIILTRLPLKSIATSKLVCKQWKTIMESPFFRELFLSHHQNSHPSWSLMQSKSSPPKEVVAHYGCKIWGLPRSLGSYVSSFIAARFNTDKPRHDKVKVLAYTEVGLILIFVKSNPKKRTYYVANPVSRQCIKLPPLPESLLSLTKEGSFEKAALVTRMENAVVSGYKVVLVQRTYYSNNECILTFIIYSSETGLWSTNIVQYHLPLVSLSFLDPVCLNRNLHWHGHNLEEQEVVVSIDFYDSDLQHQVIPFPDSDKKPHFGRSCTTSQGDLMYMNIISRKKDEGGVEHKLCVWKLKTLGWQLVSESSRGFLDFPVMMNPFDGNTVYLWSPMCESLASFNLRNRKTRIHNEPEERSRDGETMSFVGCDGGEMDTIGFLSESFFSTFALPRWLYRIPLPPPSSAVAVSDPSPLKPTTVDRLS
ncbi:unnamed protein product [Microthlaspi erraticum]|uniref:F-box domain-containing protein n=1 Tax=Microthlaspi erraticum TaxID=1685480 RepID=A0A6D2IZG0_9BRAS|nr:unnamed protein product [Microthlaspi erraticum]